MTTIFPNSRGAVQVPAASNPSPEIEAAETVDDVLRAGLMGIGRYLRRVAPEALATETPYDELAKRAGAPDYLDRAKSIEIEIDQACLRKAPIDKIKQLVGRWEVLHKAIIRAIEMQRQQQGSLF